MDWNLFIIPLTMVATQLLKNTGIDKRWLPLIAVGIGGGLGVIFGIYYNVDLLEHIVSGIVYGASAAGIYDLGASIGASPEVPPVL